MPRFFTSAVQFDEAASVGSAVIDGEDGRHIARSLRMHTGDALTLSDGAGTDYTGEIESITGDTVMVRLTDKFKNRSEPTLRVTLYPGMPKADKLELITQKAVELGVTKIVPVLTSRSVSRPDAKSVSKKQERLQRIALEAAKQSGRGIIPEIGKMTDLESALRTAPKRFYSMKAAAKRSARSSPPMRPKFPSSSARRAALTLPKCSSLNNTALHPPRSAHAF